MLGTMGSFSNPTADPATEPLDFYIHGHASSRLMKLPGSVLTEDHPEGLPVCAAATLLDGIKLALTPFNHSCNYRSAVLHGYANLVTDEDEKSWAMQLITDGLVPHRWNNSRVPPTKAELQSTSVLRITVVSASAKINTGPAGDDHKDLQNDDVTSKVWAGVLPVWECIGPPVENKTNKVEPVPEYLSGWMQVQNASREEYASRAASEKV
jgi:nitroimidazol reductase NimA-like FMN-containing flavoprotein (pyridoxamine 5'-phosphate oxidase superfamily)